MEGAANRRRAAPKVRGGGQPGRSAEGSQGWCRSTMVRPSSDPRSRVILTKFATRVLFFPLCLVLATCAQASAQGVPSFDPELETVLVGNGVEPPEAATQGEVWKADASGVVLDTVNDDERTQNYWIPTSDEAVMRDGFIRFRFDIGDRLDSTILFRGEVDLDDPAGFSGYGLSLERDTVHMYRWDAGGAMPLGESERVRSLRKIDSVEGAIWMIGPHITAHIYDGEDLETLATLVVTDTKYASGRIGLRAYGRQDADTKMTLLSLRAAGTDTGERDSPIGFDRYVAIRADDVEAIPGEANAKPLQHIWGPEGSVIVETNPRGLEIIRRSGVGVVEVVNMPTYSLTDPSVREARADGLQRTEEGFRIDQAYKDPERVEALMRGYHERYPEITKLVEIGRTHEDRPILAIKISDRADVAEDEPPVMLNSAHHGVELLSTEFAIDAMAQLLEHYDDDKQIRRFVDELEIWIVPLVNPDGNAVHMDRALFAGRKNARDADENGRFGKADGVDLNRNYPFRWGTQGELASSSDPRHRWYRGPRPGSEPETQAMMRLADSEHFVASISYHTWGTVILSPYTIDDVDNPEPDEAWPIAEAMASGAGVQPNGRTYRVQRNIYSVTGVDQDWFRAAHGTAAFLVEGIWHNPSDEKRIEAVEANRGTWRTLFEKVLEGPSVYGHVRTTDGDPVVAEIVIENIDLREGEHWTSRCHDGRFERLLPGPGRYAVKAQAPGMEPVTKTVNVGHAERQRVELEVPSQPSSPLAERLCPDPKMCAADTVCHARAGRCVDAGAATYCLLDGTCHAEGDPTAEGCATCRPARLALEWFPAAAGTTCAESSCQDGVLTTARTCDGSGTCVAPARVPCTPYATCGGEGQCAATCSDDTACADGFRCVDEGCVDAKLAAAVASLEPSVGEEGPEAPEASQDEPTAGPDDDDARTCSVSSTRSRGRTPRELVSWLPLVLVSSLALLLSRRARSSAS